MKTHHSPKLSLLTLTLSAALGVGLATFPSIGLSQTPAAETTGGGAVLEDRASAILAATTANRTLDVIEALQMAKKGPLDPEDFGRITATTLSNNNVDRFFIREREERRMREEGLERYSDQWLMGYRSAGTGLTPSIFVDGSRMGRNTYVWWIDHIERLKPRDITAHTVDTGQYGVVANKVPDFAAQGIKTNLLLTEPDVVKYATAHPITGASTKMYGFVLGDGIDADTATNFLKAASGNVMLPSSILQQLKGLPTTKAIVFGYSPAQREWRVSKEIQLFSTGEFHKAVPVKATGSPGERFTYTNADLKRTARIVEGEMPIPPQGETLATPREGTTGAPQGIVPTGPQP